MNSNLDDFSRNCVAETQRGRTFWVDATTIEIKRIQNDNNTQLG